MEWPHAEESLPARVATIGGKFEALFQENKCAFFHALARDVLEIKISALRAMSIFRKEKSHAPGAESAVAGVASPWPQPCECGEKIQKAASMRSKTVCATALWTDHLYDLPPRLGTA